MLCNQVKDYIEKNWDLCIKKNETDGDPLIGVPFPYTVPAVGHFDAIYYWDTYFTNVGLFFAGRAEQAMYNTDNILYLIEKYGYMPNGNHNTVLNRSQPPFSSLMVYDVYKHFQDKTWLKRAYGILEIEYEFWMTQRMTEIGLNRYGYNEPIGPMERYERVYCERVGYRPDLSTIEIAKQFLATAECGWDISPRFGDEVMNYIPVDLNSILYQFEMNMRYFADELEINSAQWKTKAEIRKKRMDQYLDCGKGVFWDYHYVKKEHSNIFSAANLFPLFVELADEKQESAILENLYRIEAEYGILACEDIQSSGVYQWGYPNGWACLQFIAMHGLEKYGKTDEAKRIAKKYTDLVESVFSKTGKLWEKYNVVEGNIQVVNEYDMPPMMGWTAGVYLDAKCFLETDHKG